jgi:hypothetical protein
VTAVATARDAQFGYCDTDDFAALAAAMTEMHEADAALWRARERAGAVMKDMLDKGALRKSVARLAGVSDQTVTNLALGRPKKKGS